MKETKEKWIQKECLSINQDIRNGIHFKRTYQTIKALTNSSTKKKTRVIKHKDGTTISENTEMIKRWTEGYIPNELYNHPINPD